MALERFDRLPAKRQALILQGAADELATHGANASMNRILQATGISKGQFYYYFADRDDLFATVVLHEVEKLLDGITDPRQRMKGPETFWPCIQQVTLELMLRLEQSPRSAAFLRLIYASSSQAVATVREPFDQWTADVLLVGQQMGVIRSDMPHELLVAAVSGMAVGMDRWFAMAWGERPPEELIALTQAAYSMAEEALRPR